MRVTDLTVEVRDKTLKRVGKIPDGLLRGVFTPVHNGVGSWSLELPATHALAGALRVPGSGIIVTGPGGEVLLSGPMTNPNLKTSAETPTGLVTIGGVSDDVLLADDQAWPQPTNANPATQTVSHDNRSGPAETVMRAYVNANIGPGAPAARRSLLAQRLTLAPDLGRGRNTVRSARFPQLGELLAEIATFADLGFRIVQRGPVLVFEVYPVTDRTKFVRLDVANGSLTSQEVQVSPPGATRVLVLGQGQGEARTVVARSTLVSLAAEQEWGRVVTVVKDQRNTDELLELQQAGDELLAEQGFTATNVQAIPADSTSMRYGYEWREGDRVTVVVDGQETTSTVSQATILVGPDAVLIGAGIGDVKGFDAAAALAGRVEDTAARVSQLERTAEMATVFDASAITSGSLVNERLPAPVVLPSGVNLDAYTSRGWYHQASNVAAGAGANYPAPRAGLLEVQEIAEFVYQWYTTYTADGRTYTRNRYLGAWGPWSVAGGGAHTMAAGFVDVSYSSGTGAVTATLPAGKFTQPPLIFLTPWHENAGISASSVGSTTSSFQARVRNNAAPTSSGVVAVRWLAVQMSYSSAIG